MQAEIINKPEIEKTADLINSESEKKIDETSQERKVGVKKKESKAYARKNKLIDELVEKIKNSKTLMIVSIKNLPSKQFQEIKKSLRGKVLIKVAKKNILLRTIKKIGKESILSLEKQIQENCAFAISDMEGFELAGTLSKEKTSVAAKAGQISPDDIEVKAGPTSLVPGPAISELGALGIQISVEDGKISIKEPRVIIKKGQEIDGNAASVLQKLEIHPFKIGLIPLVIYDIQTEKVYTNININQEEVLENLKTAAGKALGFAQKIVYYCKDTIGYLLAKANANNQALEKFESKSDKEIPKPISDETLSESDKEEVVEEKKVEEKKEGVEEKSQEDKGGK